MPVCGFCRRGREVEKQCGTLHVDKLNDTKEIAAHHKCMQYSAALIQRLSDEFGGFRKDEVQKEMKRGNRLVCYICKSQKESKQKSTGATSGCALFKYRKTFHFYCARISDTAVTKRLMIKRLRKDKEERDEVWYRVFCCQAHKEEYVRNIQEYVNKADDSDRSEEENTIDTDVDTDASSELNLAMSNEKKLKNHVDLQKEEDELISEDSDGWNTTLSEQESDDEFEPSHSLTFEFDGHYKSGEFKRANRKRHLDRTEVQNSHLDTVLVITDSIKPSVRVRNGIKRIAEQNDVVFWLDEERDVTEKYIPFLINDISHLICEKKYDEVLKLFVDKEALHSHLSKEKYLIIFHQSQYNIFDSLFQFIQRDLSDARTEDRRLPCKLVEVQNVKSLMITINDIIDPRGKLRHLLGVGMKNLFDWSSSTFEHIIVTGNRQSQEKEIKTILGWVTQISGSKPEVVVKPDDDALLALGEPPSNRTASFLESIYTDQSGCKHSSELLVYFTSMDSIVVNYQKYVQKYMSYHISQHRQGIRRIIYLLHLDLLKNMSTMKDIVHDDVIKLCEKTIFRSVRDPTKEAVAFVVVDVTMKDTTEHFPGISGADDSCSLGQPVVKLPRLSGKAREMARKRHSS